MSDPLSWPSHVAAMRAATSWRAMHDAVQPARDYVDMVQDSHAAAVSEGFCPEYHHLLTAAMLHGERHGCCFTCGASWLLVRGELRGCACVPGDHTCGEGDQR